MEASDLPSPKSQRVWFWGTAGLGLLIIIILGGFYLLGHNNTANKQQNSQQQSSVSDIQVGNGPNYAALAQCSTTAPPLTASPIRAADYDSITPLGQIAPPDHAVPTDHMYFAFKHDATGSVSSTLRSPGKIVVISILNSGEKKNGIQTSNDYAVTFVPCKGASMLFGHVQSLSGQLAAAVAGAKWDKPCDVRTPTPGEETFYCTKTADILFNPGDEIGSVGGKPQIGAFDLGAHAHGATDPGLSVAARYPTVNAVCPLNYFTDAVKAQLLALVKRTAEPRCGQIGQDKVGTVQGAWYDTLDTKLSQAQWNTNLSFVHHAADPTVGVVGIAGDVVSSPVNVDFKPQASGTINREPSQIVPSATIYCYQNEVTVVTNSTPMFGRLLVQLSDAKTMKVEHQDGACTATGLTFSTAKTYYR